MRRVELDYQKPKRRVGPGQLWLGIALWIVMAAFLAVCVYLGFRSRHDPNAWR